MSKMDCTQHESRLEDLSCQQKNYQISTNAVQRNEATAHRRRPQTEREPLIESARARIGIARIGVPTHNHRPSRSTAAGMSTATTRPHASAGDENMTSEGMRLGLIATALMVPLAPAGGSAAEPHADRPALVVRLVHPERQAAEVLGLFAGARAAHPAAALAAWKRATRDPGQLGKPLEAVIALFNPEMAREWSVMHGSEFGFGLRPGEARLHWYVIVPHDDGTLAAAITAERLSGGSPEPPLFDEGKPVGVERLGPSVAMVASLVGEAVLAAGSREDLATGLHRLRRGNQPVDADVANRAESIDDGLIFDLAPALLTAPGPGRVGLRRAVELVRGLEFDTIQGRLALKANRLELDVTSGLGPAKRAAAPEVAVNPAWLRWVPAAGIMGVASVAFAPEAAFWNSTFNVADRVDRADPAHRDAAPLRSRLNLLAASVGARLEVDLWPHLRGLTACVMGSPRNPGEATGALVILHVDADRSAERIAGDLLPRLGRLFNGLRPPVRPIGQPASGDIIRLGAAGGKPLSVAQRGRDVLLAWGDNVLEISLDVSKRPDRSVASLCTAWSNAGKPSPRRLGALWPARCWSPARGAEAPPPAWRVLADGPPAVWWGWDEATKLHDTIVYGELRETARCFLDKVPLDPPSLP
jgi:hypothetical protein